MPLPFVPNAVKVQLYFQTAGQLGMNDLWFVGPDAEPDFSTVQTLIATIENWVVGDYLPLVCDSVTLTKIVGRAMTSATGAIATRFNGVDAGGVATEQAPNNVAPCISLGTGLGGRSSHGRNYIVGTPNAAIDVNTIQPAFIGGFTDAYAQLLPGGGNDPSPFIFSVVSYYLAGAVRAVPFSWPVRSVGFTDNIVDSQRRRLPGRGK